MNKIVFIIPALFGIIMLTGQYAHAQYINVAPDGFSCYSEWRCASGWNHAIVDATNDYTNNNYDPSCNNHTVNYCNGYSEGYTYSWNIEVANHQPSVTQQQQAQQQCVIQYSPGATCGQTSQQAQAGG